MERKEIGLPVLNGNSPDCGGKGELQQEWKESEKGKGREGRESDEPKGKEEIELGKGKY